MRNPLLASRYAKSLLDLATEMAVTEPVLNDMEHIQAIIKNSREFAAMLRSPILAADKKMAILKAVFADKFHQLTEKFAVLLVNKGREGNLEEIANAFIDQYRKQNKIKAIRVTSPAPLDESVLGILENRLQQVMPGYSFIMDTAVNPDLIGGFTLEMDDKLVDASVRRDLNDVKMQFRKNLYERNIR